MHLDPLILSTILTTFASVLASSGFWTYLVKKSDKNSSEDRVLRGLAHDRIIYVGQSYIKRGWISVEEYDDFMTYLYTPYKELGGNGTAELVAELVMKLPVRQSEKRIEVD